MTLDQAKENDMEKKFERRAVTFSTHKFAKLVKANPQRGSCITLLRMLDDRPGLGMLMPRHLAGWVFKQYRPGDVTREGLVRLGRRDHAKFALRGANAQPDPRPAIREAMADRLLAAPDKRVRLMVDLRCY